MRYTPFFLNINFKVGNLFQRLTSSFSKTSENHLLFVMKINFAGTKSPISRCRFSAVSAFISSPGSWLMKWKHNLKFLLVYIQRGYLFCTEQQRIYHINLLLLDHPRVFIWHCLLIFFTVQGKPGACYIEGQRFRIK